MINPYITLLPDLLLLANLVVLALTALGLDIVTRMPREPR